MKPKLPAVLCSLALLGMASAARAQGVTASELHDALHLSPTQEMAWRGYQAAITPDPALRARRRSAQLLLPNLSTPRRIDLIDAEMEADLSSLHKQGEAVKTFYATLTPDQQRVFDQKTLPESNGEDGAPPPPTH